MRTALAILMPPLPGRASAALCASLEATVPLVVDNTASALALAQAIICSNGGSFEVQWIGSVIINQTIHVSGGTILDVTGAADGSSVIDGGDQTVLFRAYDYGTLHLSGVTLAKANYANGGVEGGGALDAVDSVVASKNCVFSKNVGYNGGGIYLRNSSFDSSSTMFANNTALGAGGAIFADIKSQVNVVGGLAFSGNTAQGRGGALFIHNSLVSVSGEVMFTSNVGDEGGAMWVGTASSAQFSSSSRAVFFGNNATDGGGAILLSGDGAIALAGEAVLSLNTAYMGGAVGMLEGTSAIIAGNVTMSQNTAVSGGGAIYCEAPMLLAIYDPRFVSNSVVNGNGGAIDAFSPGTRATPAVLHSCQFMRNTATEDGGAVNIGGGFVDIGVSYFEGNSAGRFGGAVRASGFVTVHSTEFFMNQATAGAAVSNTVQIEFSSTNFTINMLSCSAGEILEIFPVMATHSTMYEVDCDSCPELCGDCYMHANHVHTCEPVPTHTYSDAPGGNLQSLGLDPGYWRSSIYSKEILECYGATACIGGGTRGIASADSYCGDAYTGPYCAVCAEGYAPGLGYVCSECSERRQYVAISIVLASCVILAVGGVLCLYFVGVAVTVPGRRTLRIDFLGLQSRCQTAGITQALKIIVVSLQIVSQFKDVANATYPDNWRSFLQIFQGLNLNVGWILSAGCIVDTTFHDRLLIATVGPVVLLCVVLMSYFAAKRRLPLNDRQGRAHAKGVHASIVLWVSLLIYASVSTTTFQTFACDVVQGDFSEPARAFLRADHRINCNTVKHNAFKVFAGIMCLVYPFGIPFCYMLFLCRHRDVFTIAEGREATVTDIDFANVLWKPYRPQMFYFEIIECFRRVALSGVVVFILPNTAGQIVTTFLMSVVFFAVLTILNPYANAWDAWLARAGHTVVMLSMFVALLMKVDTHGENSFSQNVFGYALVVTSCAMMVAVAGEAYGMCCAASSVDRQ